MLHPSNALRPLSQHETIDPLSGEALAALLQSPMPNLCNCKLKLNRIFIFLVVNIIFYLYISLYFVTIFNNFIFNEY